MFQVIKKTAQAEFVYVNYFGQIFAVPVTHIHMFTTNDGTVKASVEDPFVVDYDGEKFWSTINHALTIGRVVCMGDWQQSKVIVNPNIIIPYFSVVSIEYDTICLDNSQREFNYFGFVLSCGKKHGTVFATSPDGIVSLYKKSPKINDENNGWKTKHLIGEVAKIDFVGDWKQSRQPCLRVS